MATSANHLLGLSLWQVVHATAMNAQSSRGHTICKLTVVKEALHLHAWNALELMVTICRVVPPPRYNLSHLTGGVLL